jgi:hypothetical protein
MKQAATGMLFTKSVEALHDGGQEQGISRSQSLRQAVSAICGTTRTSNVPFSLASISKACRRVLIALMSESARPSGPIARVGRY